MFLAAQLALAVVLLAHFAVNLRSGGPGLASDVIFDRTDIVTATVTLPAATFPTPASRAAFYDTLLGRLRGVPAFAAAALTSTVPLSGGESRAAHDRREARDRRADETDRRWSSAITPGYFRALGLAAPARPGLRGRGRPARSRERHRQRGVRAEILSRRGASSAAALLSGRPTDAEDGATRVAHHRRRRPVHPPASRPDSDPVVYLPFGVERPGERRADRAQRARHRRRRRGHSCGWCRRSTRPCRSIGRARCRRCVTTRNGTAGCRTGLFTFLTFIAVALATVGLYAVTAHGVSRERHEIGIRMALGARPRQIVGRVLRRLVGPGRASASAPACCSRRCGTGRFPAASADIRATDLVPLAVVAAILLAVIVLAAIVPSRRACRVDPLLALRTE